MNADSRALRVTHLIHDLRPGGAEHVLVDLAGVAPQAGLEISVVSMLPLESFEYARQLVGCGVTVASLDLAGWWDPRARRRLGEILGRLRPQVLHSHLKHADVIAGRAAQRLGIPHVSTLHLLEADVDWVAARKRDVATTSRKRTAARTIAVSDAVRSWYLEVSGADPASVVTLRNGVPDPGPLGPDEVAAARDELGVPHTAILALMVAVMRPGKGHDALLDALPLVQDDSVVFAFAGDGPCSVRLRQRAAGYDRVRFLGFRHDIARLLAAADLVVHPSEADALPTALVHALAAGKPIIASDVGGIPEIVTEDGGVLVPVDDAAALAAAIDRMARDSDARQWMGKRNRERYDAEFRADAWARGLRRLYEDVLDSPSGSVASDEAA